MPRASRAGSRVPRYRLGYGRISDSRYAWLRTYVTRQLSILKVEGQANDEKIEDETDEGDFLDSEEGPSWILSISVPGRKKPMLWNFSYMTLDELQATREFFDHLFDLAEPVVRQRDKVAHEAAAQGDDSYGRIYRELPTLTYRKGKERPDDQGIHHRPSGSSEGDRDGFDPSGGLRRSRDELANGEPTEGGIQDYPPQAD